MHTHKHTDTYAHAHTRAHIPARVHTHPHTCAHTHPHTHVHTNAHAATHTCALTSPHTHTHTHAHTHRHTCTHPHSHTHTHRPPTHTPFHNREHFTLPTVTAESSASLLVGFGATTRNMGSWGVGSEAVTGSGHRGGPVPAGGERVRRGGAGQGGVSRPWQAAWDCVRLRHALRTPQFETHKLFISGRFHVTLSDHRCLRVNGKAGKGRPLRP